MFIEKSRAITILLYVSSPAEVNVRSVPVASIGDVCNIVYLIKSERLISARIRRARKNRNCFERSIRYPSNSITLSVTAGPRAGLRKIVYFIVLYVPVQM